MDTIRRLEQIGIRLAGSPQEQSAADWIQEKFGQTGLYNPHQQKFPCLTFGHSRCETSILVSGQWKQIDSEPAAHTPSTPSDGVEGELLFIEKIPESPQGCKSLLKGKIGVVYYSALMKRLANFQNIMQAEALALLIVDDRIPNGWTVAIGFPRYWVDFISCPLVNISYMDAWELARQEVRSVRLQVDAFVREAASQNVIGEIRGTGAPDEVIVISGHHDSVANNPGVDDNCTGVAAVLELARIFSKSEPLRTLRFLSFGTEEQLSEGARHYALTASDIDHIQFVLNIDSIGAVMGQTRIYCSGPEELQGLLEEVNNETGFPGHIIRELSPFSDHFPLNLRGIPAVWYYRQTFRAARHYHHSTLETLDVLSPKILESTLRHQAALLDRLANQTPIPCPRRLTEEQKNELQRMAKEWFGA